MQFFKYFLIYTWYMFRIIYEYIEYVWFIWKYNSRNKFLFKNSNMIFINLFKNIAKSNIDTTGIIQ